MNCDDWETCRSAKKIVFIFSQKYPLRVHKQGSKTSYCHNIITRFFIPLLCFLLYFYISVSWSVLFLCVCVCMFVLHFFPLVTRMIRHHVPGKAYACIFFYSFFLPSFYEVGPILHHILCQLDLIPCEIPSKKSQSPVLP